MHATVLRFLRPRLDPGHLLVGDTLVQAPLDPLLTHGGLWSVGFHQGRLVAEVSLRDVLLLGQVDTALAHLSERGEGDSLLAQTLRDEAPEVPEGLSWSVRLQLALAEHALGRTPDAAAIEALRTHAPSGREARRLERTVDAWSRPPEARRERPVRAVERTQVPLLMEIVRKGDLEGGWAQVTWAVDHLEYLRPLDLEQLAEVQMLYADTAGARVTVERLPWSKAQELWPRLFGAEGQARVDQARERVLAVIDAAFDGVPFPGPDHRSLHQANAWDDYERCDQSLDHTGRWQDLPREHLLANQWALAHLDGPGLHYVLPAAMSLMVREGEDTRPDHGSGWIFESTRFTLYILGPNDQLAEYQRERLGGWTPAQYAALVEFAVFIDLEPKHIASLRDLAEGRGWPS